MPLSTSTWKSKSLTNFVNKAHPDLLTLFVVSPLSMRAISYLVKWSMKRKFKVNNHRQPLKQRVINQRPTATRRTIILTSLKARHGTGATKINISALASH